jgi:hypothetical protein
MKKLMLLSFLAVAVFASFSAHAGEKGSITREVPGLLSNGREAVIRGIPSLLRDERDAVIAIIRRENGTSITTIISESSNGTDREAVIRDRDAVIDEAGFVFDEADQG